jgi:1-acyl-sn-glycerol-3-phosphate acyltransferase
MKAKLPKKLWLMLVVLYATLRISILNIYKVYIGSGYDRAYGDKIFRWYANTLCDSVRMHRTVNDPYNLKLEPGKPYMVMCNHRSLYDIPLSVAILPGSVRFLTKQELRRVPIWGKALDCGEFVFIDRSDLEKAKQSLAEARKIMKSGVLLWVAAEGTRSDDSKLGAFKKGGFITAIEAGATIIPVGIRGTEKVMPPRKWEFYLDQEVSFNIGTPIDASAYTLEQRDELIEVVRAAIAELTGETA